MSAVRRMVGLTRRTVDDVRTLFLNPALVTAVEITDDHDTVVHLAGGQAFLVAEGAVDVVDKIERAEEGPL